MSGSRISRVIPVLLLLAGFAGVWKLQHALDAQREALGSSQDEVMLRSPKLIKNLSLEYAPLVGALYWTDVVQYYGNKHRFQDQNLSELWPLLDITTTLDPHLVVAYRVGSVFLSDAPPRGAGEPDLAVELLERGIRENPGYWRFYQDLGNVYYFDKKDFVKAAAAYEEGSKYPGTPIWMKAMAAKIATEGESLETSLFLWEEVYKSTNDPHLRESAVKHIRIARTELDLGELDRMSDAYEKKTGHRPESLAELIQAGMLPGAPNDPEGFPYQLGPEGKARVSSRSPMRQELETEKK